MSSRSVATFLALALGVTVLGAPPALAATEYRVDEDHDGGWHRQAYVDTGICKGSSTRQPTGGQTFEPGPAGLPPTPTPPLGNGSLEFRTGDYGPTVQAFRNTRYAGKKLSDINGLSYWTYVDPESSPASVKPDPSNLFPFQVAVTVTLKIQTGDGNSPRTLTYEPAYQGNVERARWQYWDLTSETGRWHLDGDQTPANMKSLEQWSDVLGDAATIVNETPQLGGVMLSAGCGDPTPWAGFVGNTDEFSISFLGDPDITVYDMEPPSVPGGAEHLDCDPETEINPSGSLHVITCVVTNALGAPVEDAKVVAEITGANDPEPNTSSSGSPTSPDLDCTTNEDGECTLRHGPNGRYTTSKAGTTTYRVWIDEDAKDGTVEADLEEGRAESSAPGSTPEGEDGDNTDVVEKTWVASRLDCVEESVTLAVNSSNTIVCEAKDASGVVIPGTVIDMEATGVNDPDGFSSTSLIPPDFTCTTLSDGKCPMTHGPAGKGSTATAGRTTYRAWIDYDNRDSSNDADTTEGRDEKISAGNRAETDNTDVVEANWTSGTTTVPCYTPSPVPPGSPSPTPSGTPCPTQSPTPTPTPSTSPSPRPTPTPTPSPTGPADDRLRSGPCEGYLPDSRGPRPGGGLVIVGTRGPDELTGSDGDDLVCSLGGADVIRGKRGSDEIHGGRAGDRVRGGNGHDTLKGGRGNDELRGGKGKDSLFGGAGRDGCIGGTGRNRLRGCE